MSLINTYDDALKYLQMVATSKIGRPGEFGFERVKHFLHLLGNPQNQLKVIHIAGTSGKGSTAFFISHLLQAHGLKVGLHLSPHLIDFRERLQINSEYLEGAKFVQYLNQIIPTVELMQQSFFGQPTFFEIVIGLVFHTFYQERVDYAVVESGLGGLLDGTNVATAPSKTCVLTRQGLDHQDVLGSDIRNIIYNDVGIIHPGNQVISLASSQIGIEIAEYYCHRQGAKITMISDRNYSNVVQTSLELQFDFCFKDFKLPQLKLAALGAFQAENSALALTTLYELSLRDKITLNQNSIRQTLQRIKFHGRFELLKIQNKIVVIDSAHNPQKMDSLLESLESVFPNKRLRFLLAFKSGKDYVEMIQQVVKVATQMVITEFGGLQDARITSVKSSELQSTIQNLGLTETSGWSVEPDLPSAFNTIFQNTSAEEVMVITGSMYYLERIYHLADKLK